MQARAQSSRDSDFDTTPQPNLADTDVRASDEPSDTPATHGSKQLPLTHFDEEGSARRFEQLELLSGGIASRSSTLTELIEAIGDEGTLKLIGTFGGTRLYVPHLPEASSALAECIGLDAAQRLARTYGGDRVDVPNPTKRRVQILQLRQQGLSVDAIARELRCTRRRVFQVLAEARTHGPS
jgi:hypothetical protein